MDVQIARFKSTHDAVSQRVMAACLLLSLLVAAWASVARGPYSPALPKRVWMQHLSDVDATTGNASHRYVLGSWDNIPCSAALPEGAMNRTPLNHTGREWLVRGGLFFLCCTIASNVASIQRPSMYCPCIAHVSTWLHLLCFFSTTLE